VMAFGSTKFQTEQDESCEVGCGSDQGCSRSALAMMTPGARWKRRFPFLICGWSRQLPTQSSSRLSFGGNFPTLILSSSLPMKAI